MMKRLPVFDPIENETTETMILCNWIFDSHNWTELRPGYFYCGWCGMSTTSTQGWGLDRKLCLQNPAVKTLLDDIKQKEGNEMQNMDNTVGNTKDTTEQVNTINGIGRRNSNFREELKELINEHSMENLSDTADFILAEYLTTCLLAFEKATERRDGWLG